MVKQIQLEKTDNPVQSNSSTADEFVVRSEEDGFYSSCGQAYIRIDRN
ncbi:hypothetical protein [Methanolobus profundi]|uniref:Uncharacterized protein n=1 Tax=Methanolobus profundi TaxID=487685 RepID=A0A1I4USG9_9EURY|nr:hypothetical protein [Methanolobus profundi]SFM91868.1 hypothetical protein SAMN04488696_2848 [Methanolobus profundi]